MIDGLSAITAAKSSIASLGAAGAAGPSVNASAGADFSQVMSQVSGDAYPRSLCDWPVLIPAIQRLMSTIGRARRIERLPGSGPVLFLPQLIRSQPLVA